MKTIQVVASIIHQDGKILATQRGVELHEMELIRNSY